ncbi:serine hydrolase domain-containing protein [Paracraurococcus lichenis]|uniref:Serine hydrolase n=1 Tax=Paracraurococcus lichenis TaxID=3064888 RepID=A0ABT9ECN4_9PROT|nr:serine hydrolase [Paracraurococcus sp. LOR1-02]MDO9713892.1 serine hydrolase [Paracraurococcus sp. LOR1-02]
MSRVADPERAAPDIRDATPEGQETAFRDWPHRVVRRAGAVRPLPPHARSLSDLTFEVGGARLGLGDYMARRRTAGLLILKRGEVAAERYGVGGGPESLWTGYSTAKSITSTLVGAALHDGSIGSLDERCDRYLPRLRGSAYEGLTIRNALRMCSGVVWSDVEDEHPEHGRLQRALVSRRPGSLMDLLCTLPRARPQGAAFNYSTVDTYMLGALVAAATGRPLAEYCAEAIWGPAGMEADAYWALEAEGGRELGGAGLGARLRDLGRFGLLVLEDGEAFSGRRVLPPGWRDLAGQPDSAPTGFGRLKPGIPAGYGYQWWALPHGPTGVHAGAFVAIGAFGQHIYINPAEHVVIAIQSAWPQHQDSDAETETFTLIGTAVHALRSDPAS